MNSTQVITNALISVADFLIFISYFTIPALLVFFYKKLGIRFPVTFLPLLIYFVLFITTCGITHLVMGMYPYLLQIYYLDFIIKWITAIISILTVYELFIMIPKVVRYPVMIEHELTSVKKHEKILQNNINIFKEIREYTGYISNSDEIITLIERMGELFFKKLQIENVIYTLDHHGSNEKYYTRKKAFPDTLISPSTLITPLNENNIFFKDTWWCLIQFKPFSFNDNTTYQGFIAMKNINIKNISMLTNYMNRETYIINGNHIPATIISLQENIDTITVEIEQNEDTYRNDIVMDVIEHFESRLEQLIQNEQKERLIKELQERNDTLNKVRQETNVILKENREWLSLIAHDIRTPLFAILSISEFLLDNFKDISESYSSMQTINKSSKYISNIIDNILEFTNVNKEIILDKETFDIRQLIHDSITLCTQNSYLQYPRIMIDYDKYVPVILIGDPLRIKQFILNLFNTIINITLDNGFIKIHIYLTNTSESSLNIHIKLNANNIKKDVVQNFKFIENTEYVISKQLCKLLNGDIVTESTDYSVTFMSFFKIDTKDEDYQKSIYNMTYKLPASLLSYKIHIVSDSIYLVENIKNNFLFFGYDKNLIYLHLTKDDFESQYNKDTNNIVIVDIRCYFVIKYMDKIKSFINSVNTVIIYYTNSFLKRWYKFVKNTHDKEINEPISAINIKYILENLSEKNNYQKKTFEKLNLSVLVAEDNLTNKQILKKMLEMFYIKPYMANNGEEAVNQFITSNTKYDVILMDIMMPIMDGFEATQKIRELTQNKEKPWIIAVTAKVFWEDKLKAKECGINDFLSKPLTIEVLYEALKKVTL